MNGLTIENRPEQGIDLIGGIVRVKRFAPVIDLQWADTHGGGHDAGLIDNYIITEELAGYFEKILESCTLERYEKRALKSGDIQDKGIVPRAHILKGQYGTGKSYFLLMTSVILEALADENLYREIYGKFSGFEGIRFHMDNIRAEGRKYVVIRIDGVKNAETRFSDLVRKSVMAGLDRTLGVHDFLDSYRSASKKLEEYRNDPSLSALLASELASRSMEYGALVHGLSEMKRESLEAYRDVMEAITRHRIGDGFASLEAFLKSVSAYIKSRGYYGLFIIFDEFSAYINASIEERRITVDLAAIQSLAQLTVPREGQDIHFLCAMHADMEKILGNVITADEELRKVRGRFSEMSINFDTRSDLVENILVVNRERFAQAKSKYAKFFGALPVRYPNLEKVYPIHPQAIGSIIRVSEKYAQSERTIFSFFAEAVSRKVREPVVVDGRLNLITAREIYDYFIDYISERSRPIKESALRCISFCRDELQKDVVKALVVACVSAGEDSDARLSPRDLAFMVGTGDIQQVDLFLKEMSGNPVSNILFYEKEYRFEFIASGNAAEDIHRKVEKEASRIIPYDALLEVLEDYSAFTCIRKSYPVNPSRDILPVKKELTGLKYKPSEILKALESEIRTETKDGKLLFVIPDMNEPLDDGLIRTIRERLREAPGNICAAIPKTLPYCIEKELRLYVAVKRLDKAAEFESDEDGRKTLQKIFQPIQKIVENEMRRFGDAGNFLFIFGRDTVRENFPNLHELMKYIILHYYSKFPKMNTDALRGKNTVHNLIESFLIFGEKTGIPANYSLDGDKLIMDVLQPLGLVRVERGTLGYSAKLKLPEKEQNPESFEIWGIVTDPSRPVKEVFRLLEDAPYGLPDYLVELYIAVAVAMNQLAIRYKDRYLPLGKSSIAFINSAGYSLEKVRSATPEQRHRVKKVWLALEGIRSLPEARDYDPEAPQNDADTPAKILGDLTMIREILEGSRLRFEGLGINNRTLTALFEILGTVTAVVNPVDFLEAFGQIPDKLFKTEKSEENLKRLEQYFSFIAVFNRNYDRLRRAEDALHKLSRLKEISGEYADLKSLCNDVTGINDRVKEGLETDRLSIEDLKDMEQQLRKTASEYNRVFTAEHGNLCMILRGLLSELDSPAARMLKALEKINFKNMKRLSEVSSELGGISGSDIRPAPDDIFCEGYLTTGEGFGLYELTEQVRQAQRLEESVKRQIANIRSNYIRRLTELEEGKAVYSVPFSRFLAEKGGEAGGTPDEWRALLELLPSIEERVDREACSQVEELLDKLAPAINRFLEQPPELPGSEAKKAAPRRIGFSSLYAKVKKEVEDSGYKTVSVDEFLRIIQALLKDTGKDYDEISLGE